MLNLKTLKHGLVLFSATCFLTTFSADCSGGLGGCQEPTPCPCAADGICRPNSPAWGYSRTRWRPWPGDPASQAAADGEETGVVDEGLEDFEPPRPQDEDLRGPKKMKKDKAGKGDEEAETGPLPGADLLPGLEDEGDIFDPQGNRKRQRSQEDAPPGLPSSLLQAAGKQPRTAHDYKVVAASQPRPTSARLINPAAAISHGKDSSLRRAIYRETTPSRPLQ